MISIIESLACFENDCIAIESSDQAISYRELKERVTQTVDWLKQEKVKSVSIYAQNSVDWIIVDLACQQAGVIFTPIPLFFSESQLSKLVASVKPDIIFSDRTMPFGNQRSLALLSLKTYCFSIKEPVEVPENTSKITYTSGSTGDPKGVCLSLSNQMSVAKSLVDVIGIQKPRHLCLLPLPTLLENIAGVYSPLLAGGTIIVPSDAERGFEGSKLSNPQKLLESISKHAPNTIILVPELLQVLVIAVKRGWSPPSSLKFIAVGGSRITPSLIIEARKLNLPVFQGYGLSECSSVVSLCTLDDDINSAGQLLPHIEASIENGELVISGNTFLGYLEDNKSWYRAKVNTGDIASLKDNFVYIEGRIKNTIINSFGRNISPEWVESELLSTGMFQQVVVVGDSKPFCTALLVPASSELSKGAINDQLEQINSTLPDYAQVKFPIVLPRPMLNEQGLYTANLRPRRNEIYQYFEQQIEQVYSDYQN